MRSSVPCMFDKVSLTYGQGLLVHIGELLEKEPYFGDMESKRKIFLRIFEFSDFPYNCSR